MGYYWGAGYGRYAGWCGRGYGRGIGGGFPFISGLVWLLIIAGVVILAVALIRRDRLAVTGTGAAVSAPTTSTGNVLQIVRERYARGEIDREEYERLTKELR